MRNEWVGPGITAAAALSGLVIVVAAVGCAAWSALTLPEVHISQATGECVRVIDSHGERDCADMPTKYHHVTVR